MTDPATASSGAREAARTPASEPDGRTIPTDVVGLAAKLGLEFVEAGPSRVVARIPVSGNTQPYGLLHGGATAALCETVASVGMGLHAGPDLMVVGIELNINHLRRVSAGHVTATGVPVHTGRTTGVWDISVHDDEGRLVAVSRLTLAVRDPNDPPR